MRYSYSLNIARKTGKLTMDKQPQALYWATVDLGEAYSNVEPMAKALTIKEAMGENYVYSFKETPLASSTSTDI